MAEDTGAKGPYSVPPSADDPLILQAIQDNRPENITGLIWTPPDFTASGHKIVRTFAIDGKKRPDRSYIPCAICSDQHPKFLDGAVLWSPDKWLRLIGHQCAADPEHFGEARYRDLKQQRKQEELDQAAFDWLEAHAATAKALVPTLEQVKVCALFLEEQQKVLFKDAAQLAGVLEVQVAHHGGSLSVAQRSTSSRIVSDETGRAQSAFEEVVVGNLAGQQFVRRARTKRSRKLDGIMGAFAIMPDSDGDELILNIIGLGEARITIVAGVVFRAVRRALDVALECADARDFFTTENLATLEEWGRDIRSPVRFTLRRFGNRLDVTLEDRSRAALDTRWPDAPDLEALKQLVAAGRQLDNLLPAERSGST